MTKKLFIVLPVTDLAASTAFYKALGFEPNAQFSDDTAACMGWSASPSYSPSGSSGGGRSSVGGSGSSGRPS